MNLVKVVDEPIEVSLDKEGSSLVKIGKRYYRKTSPKVVKVGGRYFRTVSKLICKDYSGKYILKSDSLETSDGHVVDATSGDYFTYKGKKYLSLNGIDVRFSSGVQRVPISDPDLVVDFCNGSVISKSDAGTMAINFSDSKQEMSKKFFSYLSKALTDLRRKQAKLVSRFENQFISGKLYKSNLIGNDLVTIVPVSVDGKIYTLTSNKMFSNCSATGKICFNSEMISLSTKRGEIKQVCSEYIGDKSNIIRIFNRFQSMDNLGSERMTYTFSTKKLYKGKLIYDEDFLLYYDEQDKKDFLAQKSVYESRAKDNAAHVKKLIANECSAETMKENLAEKCSFSKGRLMGGKTYYNPINYFPKLSRSTNATGGIGYSFGVEFETCAGSVSPAVCDALGIRKVGDASMYYERSNLNCLEYVSPPLHGTDGLNDALRMQEILFKETFINDKCAIHIHVGGMKEGDNSSDMPNFNVNFSAAAIALGCKVEDELFSLLPERRNPNKNRYCASIKRFSKYGDSVKDKREAVSMFVFNRPDFDVENNRNSRLGRWTESRYKWLNLVNCNTDNSGHQSRGKGFKTIEFRAFQSTYDKDSMKFFVLFSLAFTWFVENKMKECYSKDNISLEYMFSQAFGKNKDSIDFVINYIEKNKRKVK